MKLTVTVNDFGTYTMALFPHLAPIACRKVLNAARLGLYNGRRIERLEPGFVLQPIFFDGTDPVMDEAIELEAKTVPENGSIRFERGTVAMAGTASSASAVQYFIALAPSERLNGSYTVIGKIISGWDTIEKLERTQITEGSLTDGNDVHTFHYPTADIVIQSVTAEE